MNHGPTPSHGPLAGPTRPTRVVALAVLAAALNLASAQAQEVPRPAESAPDTARQHAPVPVNLEAASGPPAGVSAGTEASPAPGGPRDGLTWAPASGRDCHRYRRRRVCEGPRRVPLPPEDAQARLRALGIDRGRVVRTATSAAAPAAWAEAVPGGAEDDLLWPVRGGRFWRGFGARRAAPRARVRRARRGRGARARGRGRHEGVDIGAEPGTPVVAAASGLVVYSDNYLRGYGNALVVVHRDGSVALYSHCRATLVAAGELVSRGQVIAEVGDTGLAHGPHLHFEWRVGGAPRDPLPRFVGRPDAADAEGPPTAPSEGAATAGVDRDGRAADRSEAVGHGSAVSPAPDRPSTTPLHVEDARAVNPG